MEVRHAACLQLSFFTTALLSFIDNGHPPKSDFPTDYAPLPDAGEEIKIVLRTLTATSKAVVCKIATQSMWECAEAMGGVGYMDEPDEPQWNIVRLMRDTAANMVWEGTTNVLASEVVRHLVRGRNLGAWEGWLARGLEGVEDQEMRGVLERAWKYVKERLDVSAEGGRQLRDVLAEGREIMFSLAWAVSGMLLCFDAQRDGNEVARETAKRWVLDGNCGFGEFVLPGLFSQAQKGVDASEARQRANWDCRLVWGVHLPEDAALGYRHENVGSKL